MKTEEQKQWMAETLAKVLELIHPVIVYQVADAMRVFTEMAGHGLLAAHAADLGNNPDFIALLISLRETNPDLNEALLFSRAVTIWKEGSDDGKREPGVGGSGDDRVDSGGGAGDDGRGLSVEHEMGGGGNPEALGGTPGNGDEGEQP